MGMILTCIAILLRILSNPLGNVFQKKLTESDNHPVLINFLTYFMLAILCIFPAFGVRWLAFPAQFWTYSVLAGIAGALGNSFLIKALQTGEISVLGPINSYKSVVAMIAGIFLLGENPNLWGILGIAIIITGSYFVLETTEDKFSWALLKRSAIQNRIWAMILAAIEAVFIKKILLASSPGIAFISWCWFGALFSFILLCIYKCDLLHEIKIVKRKDFSTYLYLIICLGIMQLSTNYVFNHMSVGYALSLFQLSVIVSVILGSRFFNERDVAKKLAGSVIMIAGSVMIILLKDSAV
jgi:drug/metabolite transporter (DMT)-like permease